MSRGEKWYEHQPEGVVENEISIITKSVIEIQFVIQKNLSGLEKSQDRNSIVMV